MEIDMTDQYVSRFIKMNEEIRANVIKLWEEGLSGSEIAEKLDITRNSVIGAIYRLRKQGHILSRHEDSKKNPINAQKDINKKRLVSKPEYIPLPTPKPKRVTKSKGITMEKLKYYSCRYIVEEGNYETTKYCGERANKCSYCEEHYKICYYPARTSLEKLVKA